MTKNHFTENAAGSTHDPLTIAPRKKRIPLHPVQAPGGAEPPGTVLVFYDCFYLVPGKAIPRGQGTPSIFIIQCDPVILGCKPHPPCRILIDRAGRIPGKTVIRVKPGPRTVLNAQRSTPCRESGPYPEGAVRRFCYLLDGVVRKTVIDREQGPRMSIKPLEPAGFRVH